MEVPRLRDLRETMATLSALRVDTGSRQFGATLLQVGSDTEPANPPTRVSSDDADTLHVLYALSGSFFICEPREVATDVDVAVACNCISMAHVAHALVEAGYAVTNGTAYIDTQMLSTSFVSMRHGHVNLLLFSHIPDFLRFAVATKLAKAGNVRDKAARIELFEYVRNDYGPIITAFVNGLDPFADDGSLILWAPTEVAVDQGVLKSSRELFRDWYPTGW